MLPAGKVDAIWLPEPLGTIAEQDVGAVPLADFDQGSMQNFPFTGYIEHRRRRSCARWRRARSWPTPTARRWSRRWRSTGIPPLVADNMSIDSYPLTMDPSPA